jgi:hypothetical protein
MIRARLKKKERPHSVADVSSMVQQGVNQPFRDVPHPAAATSPGGYGSGSPSTYGNNTALARNRASFSDNYENSAGSTFGGSSGWAGSPAGLAGYTGRGNVNAAAAPPIPAKVPLGNEVAYGRNVYDEQQGHGGGDMSALSRELNSIDIGAGSGGRGRVAGRRMLGFK